MIAAARLAREAPLPGFTWQRKFLPDYPEISPERRQCVAIFMILIAFHSEEFAGHALSVAARGQGKRQIEAWRRKARCPSPSFT